MRAVSGEFASGPWGEVLNWGRCVNVNSAMAGGNDDVARLLAHIRTDLDRYLARVQSA